MLLQGDSAPYHCCEEGKRIVIGVVPFFKLLVLFLSIAFQSYPELRAVRSNNIAGLTINFHVFSAEGPVPGSLDYALRLGVLEDNGCFIVYFWINVWFELLKYRRHRCGSFAFHQPGQQVGSITTKVNNGTAAIGYGVCQPVQKFLVNANFHRAFMSVIDHNFTNFPNGFVLMKYFKGFLIGGIPSGFIVG